MLFEVLKSNCRVDVVAQNGFAGFKIAIDNTFDSFTQKRFPEIGVALRPRPNGLFEVVCQRHSNGNAHVTISTET